MKKYLSLFYSLFRASLMADLEYRLNTSLKIFTDIIWYIAQLSVFEVLFSHTNSISGWTLESTRVFMGVLFVVDAFWMLFFSENLDRLSDKVRRGDLDLLLAKPVNSQFMMSLQRMSTAYIGNLFLAFTWLFYALSKIPTGIPWTRLPLLLILIPSALLIIYGIRFVFSASAVIFTRSENINYIWYQLYRLGTRPDAVYPSWLRYTILTVLPLGFIASVPARMLLESLDPLLIFGAVFLASLSAYSSSQFWRFALKHYASASS